MSTPITRKELDPLIHKVIDGMLSLDKLEGREGTINLINMFHWDWSQGVGLFSLYLYYRQTGEKRILDYLTDWFDRMLDTELPPKNVNTMCPLLTLSFLYDETKNEKYLEVCKEWAAWAYSDLPRTPEGGMSHITLTALNDGELWDDTLYMTVLFMARMGQQLGKDEYVQESIHQFFVHLKYLTDTSTGLFFHGFTFHGRHNFAKALWGRGNSWYTAGLVDYLDLVTVPEGVKKSLLGALEQQAAALKSFQHESGMWHTLINDPDTYLETSATAGFAFGILKAVRMGYLPKAYEEVGMRGARAVIDQIDAEGTVHNVSYGTAMGRDLDYYRNIRLSPMPYGQSMALLMLVETAHHVQ